MSSRTSSRSTLTMVPSTMSPSLKYLMVLSMAARKSSAEPMSLTATCGEVTEGEGMWWVAPDRFTSRDNCVACIAFVRIRDGDQKMSSCTHRYVTRVLDQAHAGQTGSPEGRSDGPPERPPNLC